MNTTSHSQPRLGIDIGRVIIDGSSHPQGGDTAFFTGDEETMLATPEMVGAIEAIARLVEAFEGRAWLVSKCGPRVQGRTERWLRAHDFHQRTGMPEGNRRFCRARADKRIHAEELHLTHLIDDRLDVHVAVRNVVPHLFLFGPQESVPAWVTHVPSWAEAEAAVLATLGDPKQLTSAQE